MFKPLAWPIPPSLPRWVTGPEPDRARATVGTRVVRWIFSKMKIGVLGCAAANLRILLALAGSVVPTAVMGLNRAAARPSSAHAETRWLGGPIPLVIRSMSVALSRDAGRWQASRRGGDALPVRTLRSPFAWL
jgi:hypothetical protein